MFKKIYYSFIGLSGHFQIVVFILISALIVSVFAGFFGFESSLKVFLDPGNFDATVGTSIFGEFLLLISGIILSGMIIGTIVNGFEQLSKDAELMNVHKLIKDAFETISAIRIRKLLKELNLISHTRMYEINEAEIRLELTNDEIISSIKKFGQSRLRLMKNTKNTVIESFEANKEYGCYKDRMGEITIISTQNYSDAGIGHFSSTIAANLNANYISNEFFSTGAPLKSKHINFANNESFSDFTTVSSISEINEFKNHLKGLSDTSSLIVYLGTSNDQRANDIHILFGGELGQSGYNIKNSTYNDLEKLKYSIENLKASLDQMSYKLTTHEEFGNNNDSHLSRGIHKATGKNVVTIFISTAILWTDDDVQYYKVLKHILDFISAIKT